MAREFCSRDEAFAAHVAVEALVADVPADVVVVVGLHGEASAAYGAEMGPGLGVLVFDDVVRAEGLVGVEALVADVAAVAALVEVDVLVDVEVAALLELLAAEAAYVEREVVVFAEMGR